MLTKLIDFGETITLVPQSGIQFIEFGFDLAAVGNFSRSFIERPSQSVAAGDKVEYQLLPNWDDNRPADEQPHSVRGGDIDYTIRKEQAVATYLDRWLPVPFLRIQPGRDAYNNETYAEGPFDWARLRITETRKAFGDTEATHRVVFAFDTALVEQRPGRAYLGISRSDAQQTESFRFVHRLKDIAPFLSSKTYPGGPDKPAVDTQAWLSNWLSVTLQEVRAAREPRRRLGADDFERQLEHVAIYLALVNLVAEAIDVPRITLVDTVSADPRVAPIDVDLVLDVGNSRTCGLLIQSFPNDQTIDLNRSLVLELRDLGNPVLSYRDPFESQVELAHAEFGREDLAKKSGRSRAFFWPSLVRLGPEATRYRIEAEGTEANTGLSSPKRYLWDTEPVSQTWGFRGVPAAGDIQPLVERSIYKFVNNRGDVLDQVAADSKRYKLRIREEDTESAEVLRFSRSSFFTFMTLEIISQALLMINSPGARRRDREKDAPRRLRNIVMTIPSATPIQEQRIIRSRVEAAIKLLWSLMGWSRDVPGAPPMPEMQASWDEASSVHLVYLYGEITQKLGGNISQLLDFMGKPRPKTDHEGQVENGGALQQSIRIASVDIGGGTTDLMVTTYYQVDNRALIPVQNFREGFRRAGDDLVKLVIERMVIASIEQALTRAGLDNARDVLRDRFADDRPGMEEADKHQRRQFVLRLLRPAALSILEVAEGRNLTAKGVSAVAFKDFFEPGAKVLDERNPILGYLQNHIRSLGIPFSLADVVVPIDVRVVDECIRATFEAAFANIAEAIYKLDADVVLLTGRPSCLPGLISLFRNQHAVPVDRLIPIRDYRVGNWYPFRAPSRSLIDDPKTTAVVGGMLCALASGHIQHFALYTNRMVMRSTARFIGEMRQDGVIDESSVYFRDVDLDEDQPRPMVKDVIFHTTVRVGYRQLDREDWVATPLYRLRLRPGDKRRVTPPIRVTIERRSLDIGDDQSEVAIMNSEATSEEFVISSAEDDSANSVTRLMELKFDTSPVGSDGTYWLDSGILTIA